MKVIKSLTLSLFLGLAPQLAHAQTVSGSCEFLTRSTLGAVKIPGKGGVLSGTVQIAGDKATGTLECDLTKLTTDNDLRDKHMREKYLMTAANPKAKLVLDEAPAKGGDFKGKLTIKGDTKPVTGKVTMNGAEFEAKMTIQLTDFPSVGVPEWKGITVAGEVEITVKGKVGT